MALRIINCSCSSSSVLLLPRAPDSSLFDSSKAARLSVKEDEGSWRSRSRCALGLASLILAIELGDVFVAGESRALESPPQLMDSRRAKISRWSDKRKCAPWRANSLQVIVPENLPRPSQRRKWEAIAYVFTDVKNAPEIQKREETERSGSFLEITNREKHLAKLSDAGAGGGFRFSI